MISGLLKGLFGNRNRRKLKKLWPLVAKINKQFEEYESLSDDELRANTDKFKERIKNGETVDDLLVEAFATVKSACKRFYVSARTEELQNGTLDDNDSRGVVRVRLFDRTDELPMKLQVVGVRRRAVELDATDSVGTREAYGRAHPVRVSRIALLCSPMSGEPRVL